MIKINVTCPFCGLMCDDLKISINEEQIKLQNNNCALAVGGFESASQMMTPEPLLKGKTVPLSTALDESALFLRHANAPLIGGLATDVNGMRSAMALADRCGGIIDHLDSQAIFSNLRVLQDTGWMTTTLTEVRNRAELVVVIGSAVVENHPRFFERIILPRTGFQKQSREIVLLGPWNAHNTPKELKSPDPIILNTDMDSVRGIIAALRALVGGRFLDHNNFGGIELNVLTKLAIRLKQSKYSVLCWSAGEFKTPHAELTIEQIVALINDLNLSTRAAGLPLGGNYAGTTASQVCTWQCGVPLRSSFASGQPQHDAFLFGQKRLLENQETDCLLWVSGFRPEQRPPDTTIPTIVIGHPAMQFKNPPEIFIPTAIPGIDHSGHGFRMDGSVALRLQQLRSGKLPTAADILSQLTRRLS